jgi:hypothetical protein
MHQLTHWVTQQAVFDFAASDRDQQLPPESRQACRMLLVQLLRGVIEAERQERNSHERQDRSSPS